MRKQVIISVGFRDITQNFSSGSTTGCPYEVLHVGKCLVKNEQLKESLYKLKLSFFVGQFLWSFCNHLALSVKLTQIMKHLKLEVISFTGATAQIQSHNFSYASCWS